MPQSKCLCKSQEWKHQVTSEGIANLLIALKLVSDRIRIQNYLLKIEAVFRKEQIQIVLPRCDKYSDMAEQMNLLLRMNTVDSGKQCMDKQAE